MVILMLENGAIVTDVLFEQGVAEALRPGSIVVDMSSIKPAEAQEHARLLVGAGRRITSTRRSPAEPSAPSRARLPSWRAAMPRFLPGWKRFCASMGRPVHVGPHGAGQLAKLANQIIVGVTIGAVAEALLLAAARRSGPRQGSGSAARRICRKPRSRTARSAHGGAGLRHQRALGHASEGSRQRP